MVFMGAKPLRFWTWKKGLFKREKAEGSRKQSCFAVYLNKRDVHRNFKCFYFKFLLFLLCFPFLIFDNTPEKIYHQSIVKVKKVVDTTGAGDAFASSFLGEYLKKDSIEAGLKFGAENASSVIQKLGAQNGLMERKRWKSLRLKKT